jgi:hypothetical protein
LFPHWQNEQILFSRNEFVWFSTCQLHIFIKFHFTTLKLFNDQTNLRGKVYLFVLVGNLAQEIFNESFHMTILQGTFLNTSLTIYYEWKMNDKKWTSSNNDNISYNVHNDLHEVSHELS